MITLTLISFLIFSAFIAESIRRFGITTSYSALASKWDEAVSLGNLHLWSLVTAVVAFLLCPPLLETSKGDPFQFMAFFAPVYLIVVALTPEWDTDKKQHIIHTSGAIVCAICAFVWLLAIRHLWWVVAVSTAIMVGLAIWQKRYDAYVYWGEMIMFLSVYIALLI